MRSLSSTLLAAQKAASGVPYVRCVVANKIRGMRHYVFAQAYSGSEQDDRHGAAADTTYLHRARVRAGNAQYERNAGTGFTTLSSAADAVHVAIAVINNARVIVVYNRGLGVYFRESTDQGGTFSAEALITTSAGTVNGVAVAYKLTTGDLAVFFIDGAVMKRIRRSSGTFGAVTAWAQTAATLTGVAVVYNGGDFLLVVTGTETTTLRPSVWSLALGDGGNYTVDSWTAFFVQLQAEADESVIWQAPGVGLLEVLRVTFVEKYSGAPAYKRTYWTGIALTAAFSPGKWEWLDPVPTDDQTEYGLAVTKGKNPQQAIYSRPGRVLEAATAAVTLDLSADLLEATIEEADGLTQRAELVFDNSNGQYAGPPAPIARHRDVALALGYDAAYSSGPSQSIVGWEYRRDGRRSLFVLHTRGNDYWLALARTRTSIVDTRTMMQISRAAAARSGLDFLSSGSSSRANNLSLGWVVHPQQSQLEVLRALAEMMPDEFLTYSVGTLLIREPVAGTSSVYTYGGDHAIYESRYGEDVQVSVAEVMAVGVLGQAWDFVVMNSDKPVQDRRRSPHETVQADVDAHATARLRKSVLAKDLGYLVTPPNCGLEVGDVVDFIDAAIGGSAVKGRVRSLRTVFKREGKARYEQRVGLGGV
jgi:hypothetical protein